MEQRPRFADAIPDDVICKYGVSWMLAPEFSPKTPAGWEPPEPMDPTVRPPTTTSMAHVHFGSGWWGCSPRGTLEIARYLDVLPRIEHVGFQGVCMHGEDSELLPASELNYHVYAALAETANAQPEDIAERSVGDLYGSVELATDVLRAFKDRQVPDGLAPSVARAASAASGQTRVRLNWLTFELHKLAEKAISGWGT
jgi:hypothetical protein